MLRKLGKLRFKGDTMSSSKLFYIVLCLLCTTIPARAGQPNDNRATDSSQRVENGYVKEWGGRRFDEWLKDLKYNPDPSYRAAAMLAMIYFKQTAADAVPDIINRLREDGDASPRVKAALLLRMIPHHATDRTRIIKALAHSISHDTQSIIRYEALRLFANLLPVQFRPERRRGRSASRIWYWASKIEARMSCATPAPLP